MKNEITNNTTHFLPFHECHSTKKLCAHKDSTGLYVRNHVELSFFVFHAGRRYTLNDGNRHRIFVGVYVRNFWIIFKINCFGFHCVHTHTHTAREYGGVCVRDCCTTENVGQGLALQ